MILRRQSLIRPGVAVALAAALIVALPASRSFAHDIPASVRVLAFVRPEGQRLQLVVRVPLEAMRDVNFPVHGPGYLDLRGIEPLLRDAAKVWIANEIKLYENAAPLAPPRIAAARVSLPSDRSFTTYESAIRHTTGAALDPATELMWKQAMLDVALEYAITSDASHFSIEPALARLGVRTTTALRFVPPHGSERALEYIGDPGLVRLDPTWYQASWRFVELGFTHILDGIDHLLFIICLVIPFRKVRPLIAIVTSFTVAHSITLLASAAGFAPDGLWFPPLIEVLIALSIVYMALENIVGARLERRWLVAFGFGLVHGFGYSFALRESMQFAGGHLAASLVSFNLGVELGQLAVLAVAVPALSWAFKHIVAERMGTVIASAFVAHTAWHWMLERGAVLRQYTIRLPAVDGAFFVTVLRALLLLLIVSGAAWAMFELYGRLIRTGRDPDPAFVPRGDSK